MLYFPGLSLLCRSSALSLFLSFQLWVHNKILSKTHPLESVNFILWICNTKTQEPLVQGSCDSCEAFGDPRSLEKTSLFSETLHESCISWNSSSCLVFTIGHPLPPHLAPLRTRSGECHPWYQYQPSLSPIALLLLWALGPHSSVQRSPLIHVKLFVLSSLHSCFLLSLIRVRGRDGEFVQFRESSEGVSAIRVSLCPSVFVSACLFRFLPSLCQHIYSLSI